MAHFGGVLALRLKVFATWVRLPDTEVAVHVAGAHRDSAVVVLEDGEALEPAKQKWQDLIKQRLW